jgi:hypothetical protein
MVSLYKGLDYTYVCMKAYVVNKNHINIPTPCGNLNQDGVWHSYGGEDVHGGLLSCSALWTFGG